MPVPSGQDEVEDHRLGRPHRGGRERALGRLGRLDLVAGAAQARPQRAQDLLLVVDDEDARPLAHAGTSAAGAARQREHERRALAGARLDREPAAVRLGEAARDREPEAGARRVAGASAALERLEDPLALVGRRRPGPWSITRTSASDRRRGDLHAHRLVRPAST